MRSAVFVLGSSRPRGNTQKLMALMYEPYGAPVIDVGAEGLTPYDYEHRNMGDGFFRMMERLTAADVIVFATPVYWYAMSAQMKIFLDRWSDLLSTRKELGRKLKGRSGYLVATGSDAVLPEGFEVPFRRTCEYFDMRYGGGFYGRMQTDLEIESPVEASARAFAKRTFED